MRTRRVVVAAMAIAGCATSGGPAVDRSSCEATAVLLAEAATVVASPRPGAPVSAVLAPGSAVVLCGAQHGLVAILYPRPGERADCLRREATEQRCPSGWVTALPKHAVPD